MAAPDGAAEKSLTVLVVEDEALIRVLCAEVLEDDGFAVIEVQQAEEALAILESRTDIGILFTDINMPGLSGLELARRVHKRWPAIQLVLTSGRERPDPDAIPDDGCFRAKPFYPAAVVSMVRRVAARVR